MDIKSRIEALLLAANRPLSIIDFKEMLEISSEEEESEILNAIFNLSMILSLESSSKLNETAFSSLRIFMFSFNALFT